MHAAVRVVLAEQVTPLAAAGLALGAGTVALAAGFETVLEILGVVGLLQFGVQRLLFAEDRQRTSNSIRWGAGELILPTAMAVNGYGMSQVKRALQHGVMP